MPRKNAQRKNVTFICQTFAPEVSSTSQLFSPLIGAMNESLDMTVVTATNPLRKALTMPVLECGPRQSASASLLLRFFNQGLFVISAWWRLIWRRKPDLFLATSNPTWNLWLLAMLSVAKRTPAVFIVLDLYPEGIERINRSHFLRCMSPIWKWINGWCYRRMARVVTIGRDMSALIEASYGLATVTTIPHWSCLETAAPVPSRPRGADAPLLVHYSGNMGLWHDLESIIRGAELLKDEPVSFLFSGQGVRRNASERLSRHLGLGNVSWQDYASVDQLAAHLAQADVALVSMRDELSGIAVPSKIYGIMAVGRAVIAQVPAGSEIARIVEENESGLVVAPGNPKALANAISYLLAHPDQIQIMGHRAWQAYDQHYRLKQAIEAFQSLVKECLP